jgi:hypothetical protein
MVKFGKDIAKYKIANNYNDNDMLNYKKLKQELNKIGINSEAFDDSDFQSFLDKSIDDVYDNYEIKVENIFSLYNDLNAYYNKQEMDLEQRS